MSMNEEFQSTNEELETSKEELQTLNEELTTVNHQLQAKLEELEAANNDLANFLASTDIATVFLDTEFRIKRFTSPCVRLLRLIPSDVGRPFQDIARKFRDDDLLRDARIVLAKLTALEQEVRCEDGNWFIRRVLPYRTRENKIEGVVVTFSDVTQLKRVERVAQAARTHAESILETVREALVVLDAELRVVSVNRSFCDAFQVTPEQARERSIFEVGEGRCDNPQLRTLLREILPKHKAVTDFELHYVLPSSEPRSLLVNARQMRPAGDQSEAILLALEDVTERRAAEQKLRGVERLAAIGTFAAGMAHEINNPLAAVLMTAQFALRSCQDARVVKTSLEEIIADVGRCSLVVKSVRNFAQQQTREKQPLDLNSMVRDAGRQVQAYARRRGMRLRFELESGLPRVEAAATELEQALINVITNALEASRKGQTVVVGAAAQAGSVRLYVVDKGRGMTAEQREHACDPFFTTREKEGGTGLGLALAHGTIRRHGGTVSIESKPGRGTTVVITLPIRTPSGPAAPWTGKRKKGSDRPVPE